MLNRKTVLLAVLALVIAAIFLSTSRAPALSEKAQMGLRVDISSIAFDVLLPVTETHSYAERVARSTVNWAYTNWKGMTFGILFGATLLALLRQLPVHKIRSNRVVAAFQGLLSGAPLGVCVNCATPIAQGLGQAGIRLETSLATMMASPTLNIIVLTMMVSLFTLHFVLIKLAATVLFILFLVPLAVALAPRPDAPTATPAKVNPLLRLPDTVVHGDSWPELLWGTTREWLRNFFFLVKITLPLMILAGFIGAIVIESLDLTTAATLEPGLGTYLAIAILGTILPVPIAFDVLITAGLVAMGMPVGLAMTLFFSLGIFSIFPSLIVARDNSKQLAWLLNGLVIVAAIATGLVTELVHQKVTAEQVRELDQGMSALSTTSEQLLHDRVTEAIALCDQVLPESDCLASVLRDGGFGTVDQELCESMSGLEGIPTGNLANLCHTERESLLEKNTAIAAQDIERCTTDECRLRYLQTYSFRDDALANCELMQTPTQSEHCRKIVMLHRITHFRSPAACDPLMDPGEKAQCLQDVRARLEMEQMDLARCGNLPDGNARFTCQMVVVNTLVIDAGSRLNCDQVGAGMLKTLCVQEQTRRRAIELENYELCDQSTGRQQRRCKQDVITQRVRNTSQQIGRVVAAPVRPTSEILPQTSTRALAFETLVESAELRVEVRPLVRRGAGAGYQQMGSEAAGFDRFWKIDATDHFEPFIYGKGIATGDVDRDGYADVLIAFESGVHLYQNLFATSGEITFRRVATLVPDDAFNTFVAALIDYNNDGLLDVYASAYGGKQVVYLNEGGVIGNTPPLALPTTTDAHAMAVAFSDLDVDGDLDMVVGRWAHGIERHFRTEGGTNEIWLNDMPDVQLFARFKDDPPGPTLSVLTSDLNGDGYPDIVTGNDRQVPDQFLFSHGPLDYSSPEKGVIPATSLNTMSYDSADFNNDGLLDLFSSDMTFEDSGFTDYCELNQLGDRCRELNAINREANQYNAGYCNTLAGPVQAECLAAVALKLAIRDNNPELCDRLLPLYPAKFTYCQRTTAAQTPNPVIDTRQFAPQSTSNKYLLRWGQRYIDVTADTGVGKSNWSWNARGFDADNDGYQDIFVGTGYGFGALDDSDFTVDLRVFSNVFFHNSAGTRFIQQTEAFGLQNFANTSAYSLADADADGDLDILAYTQQNGVTVFRNENTSAGLLVSLTDRRGNSHCIGCVVRLETDQGIQIREIKASGGFLSYDEPLAHFGLGEVGQIDRLAVRWSTGEVTDIPGPIRLNHHYQVTRP